MITTINELKKILNNLYHVSLFLNRDSILKNGLNASGISPWAEDDDEYPKGTYLWKTIEEARNYGFGNGDPFDIYVVNSSNYDIKIDNIIPEAFFIEKIIIPSDIKIIESHIHDVTNPIEIQ